MVKENLEQIPTNHVIAVIAGSDSALAARDELEKAGFERPVLLRDEGAARAMDAKGEHSGPIAQVFKAIQDHLSEQQNYIAQYEEEARAGNDVIAVSVKDRDHAEMAREVLERHGARNLRFFGRLAVTDLTPTTNPSSRSEASPEPWSRT
jgi:hypothetical protein